VEWHKLRRLHIIVTAVRPCNSPLLEEMKLGRPSTGPVPVIVIEGSVMWDGFLVYIIYACVALLDLRDASLAPKIGNLSVVKDEVNLQPLSSGKTTDPHMLPNAGDNAKKESLRDLVENVCGVWCVLILEIPHVKIP
jgi:hypothetical protein